MDFYTTLSKYYDDVFGLNKMAVSFIKEQLPLNKNVKLLDVAAGTGEEAIELAKNGYSVSACDLNETMVQLMKGKIANTQLAITAHQLDMRNISQLPEKMYDGIYCIGNSFVHLDSYDEMVKVLSNFYHKLSHGGKVILQIVNFEKIKNDGMKFPVIKKEDPPLVFKRYYTEAEDKINFHMTLEIDSGKESSKQLSSVTTLTPLNKEQLSSLITKTNFQAYEFYGNFKGDEYTIQSPALIVVLEKKSNKM